MVEAILKGFALGLLLVISVGPVVFTIIKQSLNNGHKGGFSFVAGVWISDFILVILSNGFSELVKQLLEYKKAIGYVGSIFLIAMGIYFLFFKKIHVATEMNGGKFRFGKREFAKLFASGFIINTFNPSVIFFWLVNATAFSITHTWQQRIVIFSVCLLLNMAADVGKVMLAGKLRSRLTVHNLSIINKISGTILIGFGIALVYSIIFLPGKFK
ncbi:MAG: LysE family translocator [Bacteroidetes bacterium]|nr:LysE family translocator [Bacteroidota bacterium]MBS1973229.1 LysE family translocator [Bacteroidota bacterium]